MQKVNKKLKEVLDKIHQEAAQGSPSRESLQEADKVWARAAKGGSKVAGA